MKQYRIPTVPTKRGAFIRNRINKTRKRAAFVGMIYLVAIAVVSVLGCRAMFSSVYVNMGLKQFWIPFLEMDLTSSFGIMRLITSVLYALMLVILLVNGLRAISHVRYLFKKKVSRIYGLNANIGAMETLADIFASSFTCVIVFNVLLYLLQGGMAWSPIFLVGAPLTVLVIGVAVHLVCGILGSKTSAFYIQEGSEVIERKRPFGRIMPVIRNVLQIVAVALIAYFFLTSEQIHTIINIYLMPGGFDSLMANMMGLLPVVLQLLSFICICALLKHAFGSVEFSVEGPYAEGRRTYRIASFFLALFSLGVVACKYLIGEAVYTIPDIQGIEFSVEKFVGLDINALIIAVIAFVMFLLDCILRNRWTKEAKAEAVKEEKEPIIVPAPKVDVHVPRQPAVAPDVNVHIPQQLPINVHIPAPAPQPIYMQLPKQAPINVHVPTPATQAINMQLPKQAPIQVHVPTPATQAINMQLPKQAPINVHVPTPATQAINMQLPKQAPIQVHVPTPATQAINMQLPKQAPINVHVPTPATQAMNMQVPKQAPIQVHVPTPATQAINMQLPKQAPINVNVPTPATQAINMQLPKQAPINVNVPTQTAQPINVQLPQQQPIHVNVPTPAQQPIMVNVPAAGAQPIMVNVPQQKGGLAVDNVPPFSLLHLENDNAVSEPATQPNINIQVPEQPAPQIVCPMADKVVKEEPEAKEETTPVVAPIVAPIVAPVVDTEEEEEEEEGRSWELRCPTCSKRVKTKVGSQYHRCPCCGKVFHLQKKFKNILDN